MLDVNLVGVLQILDAQILDVNLPFLDVAHQLGVAVDAEQRHQLKMDCFQVEVDVELQ